jgi:replicative DNA helicase
LKGPTNEQRIISKVIHEGDMRPLLDRNVTPDWFINKSQRDAFSYILSHLEKYGSVPTKVTFQSHMGNTFKIFPVAESMEYLLDAQADHLRWQTIKASLASIEDALRDNSTADAMAEMERGISRVNLFQPSQSKIVDSMDGDRLGDRWEDYQRRESGGTLLGFSTGFPTIDHTTLGLQAGQLVTVLAQPKVGKTSLCLTMACHIYETFEKPVLFVSFEMGIRELELRQESLMARVNFKDLQAGKLTKIERKKYQKFLDRADTTFTWPFHFMDAASGSTVGAIRAQIERLDPAVVFLDGIYMMTDEATGEKNTAQALTNITRSLKRLATQSERPIVINTQALAWKSKGQRITMDSAGYSSSFAQDSDVILGLERIQAGKEEDADIYANQRMLKVLASRNSGLSQTELVFDYETGQIEEIT